MCFCTCFCFILCIYFSYTLHIFCICFCIYFAYVFAYILYISCMYLAYFCFFGICFAHFLHVLHIYCIFIAYILHILHFFSYCAYICMLCVYFAYILHISYLLVSKQNLFGAVIGCHTPTLQVFSVFAINSSSNVSSIHNYCLIVLDGSALSRQVAFVWIIILASKPQNTSSHLLVFHLLVFMDVQAALTGCQQRHSTRCEYP